MGWFCFFFSSRRRHTRCSRDWSSDCALPISVLPAHRAGERHPRHAGLARGDLRTGGAFDPLQDRGGGDPPRERHRVRAVGLLLQPRRRPHLQGRRGDGDWHRRRQRRHHLDRGCAVRRCEAVGPRPRRLQVRARGVPGSQVHPAGRHRQVSEPVQGEEFKDDFRKALPKELVQRLTRRSAWRATAALVEDVSVIAIAIAAALAFWPSPLIILLSIIIVGTRQHALFVMARDAEHYLLYDARWLNDAVGRACSTVQGLSMRTYRVIHRLHHNHLYGELDPDTALHGGYPRGRAYLVKKLLKDLAGLTAWKTYAYFLGGGAGPDTAAEKTGPAPHDTFSQTTGQRRSRRKPGVFFFLP